MTADLDELPSVSPERARELLDPPVVYLPIRHHSPACSYHVRAVIKEVSPSHVLVEGPPSFDDQLDLVLDPAAVMPLAIYSHSAFEGTGEEDELNRHGSYFPLCDYSPELVALRAGREIGAELGFIDLDYVAMASFDHWALGHTDENKLLFSDVLNKAAAELGCRNHNELWDQMVESVDQSAVDHVAAVLTYGQLARFGATDANLEISGTTARELAMANLVANAVETSGEKPVVVVTGAFHTVALPQLVDAILAGEERPVPDLPTATESGHGLIRYSFDRLDALAGYGAGMANPRWYQLEWERRNGGDSPAFRVIDEVAREIRKEGRDGQPSVPTVVDAMAAAEQLHRLRGRHVPTRLDVLDAMISCFVKGEDTIFGPVRVEAQRAMTGFAIGSVPPNTPRVPLAKDFDRRAKELGLPIETAEPKQVNLDVYRSDRDRERSRFLHGLIALDVRYGSCISPLRFSRVGGQRDLVRERWQVALDGATDVSLTEASKWGASLKEAIANRTRSELHDTMQTQPSSATLMKFVRRAAERGVHDVVDTTIEILRERIGVDPSLEAVVVAMSEAELLWVGREPLGGSSFTVMPEVAEQLYVRACQLIGRAHEAPEDAWAEIVEALGALHRMLLVDTWVDLDPALFWNALAHERELVAPGMLRGAIVGLEWRGGAHDDAALLAAVEGHLGDGATVGTGVSFLEGVISVARDALWEVDGLVAALSAAIERPDSKVFLRNVAKFRSAFAALTPAETDRVAELVMGHLGEAVNIRVTNVSEAEVLRNVSLGHDIEAQLRADGFAGWLEAEVSS